MVVSPDNATVADVVLLIEGTGHMITCINELKSSYILPMLQAFNGGPPDPADHGTDYTSTLYDLIVFYAADISPLPAVQCSLPTTSIHTLSTWIDKIQFKGGACDKHSHIAEGLATALQVFDDITDIRMKRHQTNVPRHCILVCNSEPYQLPAVETMTYGNLDSHDLVKLMAKTGISFSIFCPRKIESLYHLFDEFKSSREEPVPSKQFACNSRHMILVTGFELEEKSPPAKSEEEIKALERLSQKLAENIPNHSSVPSSQPLDEGQFKVPSVTAPSQLQATSNAMQVSQVTSVTISHVPIMSQTITTMPRHPTVDVSQGEMQKSQMVYSSGQITPQSGVVQFPRSQVPQMMPPGTNSDQNVQVVVMSNQSNTSLTYSQPQIMTQPTPAAPVTNPPTADMVQSQSNQPMLYAPPRAVVPAALQPRKVIWNGLLEWQEKSKTNEPGAKVSRTLTCQVSVNANDPDMNASKWPTKLVMQLINQSLISPLQPLFTQSRSVIFQFTQSDEAYKSLFQSMTIGTTQAGCVYFPPNIPNTDVKMLMLLYHSRRKMFMGIIPNDQKSFIDGVKQVITQHKKLQAPEPSTLQPSMSNIAAATSHNPAMAAQMQQSAIAQASSSLQSLPGSTEQTEAERQANLQKILGLSQELELARQKELQFQKQDHYMPAPGPRGMMMAQRHQMAQPQQGMSGPPIQNQGRMTMNMPPGTTPQQLRNLLLNQQQQQQHQIQMMQHQNQRFSHGMIPSAQQGQQTPQQQPPYMDDYQ